MGVFILLFGSSNPTLYLRTARALFAVMLPLPSISASIACSGARVSKATLAGSIISASFDVMSPSPSMSPYIPFVSGSSPAA